MTNFAHSASPTPTTSPHSDALQPEKHPGQNFRADEIALRDYRRLALLRLFPDSSSVAGYGAAVVFRRKVRGYRSPCWGHRGWKADCVLIPKEISQWRLQDLLVAPHSPLWVEEDQMALNLFRSLAERHLQYDPPCRPIEPRRDVEQKWGKIFKGPGHKLTALYPYESWPEEPPHIPRKKRYDTAPQSACSVWVRQHPETELPDQLLLERRKAGIRLKPAPTAL